MSLLHTGAAFVVALGVLIVVHEYGHYLAARLCGVRVLRFSVGFGRALYVWRSRSGTEWVLAAIPFGGYVKMLDERETPVSPEYAHMAFNSQSVWKRILIVIAGPLFNFAFAIGVYSALFMYGMPEARPLLAAPGRDTPADVAGIHAGDEVTAVTGVSVGTWEDLRWQVLQNVLQGRAVTLELRNVGGQHRAAVLRGPATAAEADEHLMAKLGLSPYRPTLEPVLGTILPDSPARQAGLERGDRVVAIDDKSIGNWDELVDAVRRRPGRAARVSILRDGTTLAITMTPEAVEHEGAMVGRIGAAPQLPQSQADRLIVRRHYGLFEAIGKAIAKTYDISAFSLRMLGRMVIGDVSWKHLSGPVTIADYAGQSAQLGWVPYLTFLALISISLGVLNLLPIPLLDGGHLMYYVLEVIRGDPLSERAMEIGQRLGFALLLVMMAFAFYNDLNRLFSG